MPQNAADNRPHSAPDTLANRIATELEQEIIAGGWRVGQPLGNEEQLVERFGVSRWVLREALAITERDGLTQMRRGRGGGLVVAEPAESVVATTLRNYLLFSGIEANGLLSVRQLIDGLACRLGSANLDPQALAAARAFHADMAALDDLGGLEVSTRLYRQILKLSGNRLVQIFGSVLSQLTYGHGICLGSRPLRGLTQSPNARRMGEMRRTQFTRVVAADLYGAIKASGEACEVILDLFAESPGGGRHFDLGSSIGDTRAIAELILNTYPSDRTFRRVDILALQIQLDIIRLGLAPGHPLAPEKTLTERYGVGRNVLREAIRVLQRDNIVTAAEGRQGGLWAAEPRPDNVIRSSLVLFRFMQLGRDEIDPVFREVFGLAAALAAEGGDPGPALAVLERIAAGERGLTGALLASLGRAGGNPILALFSAILATLGAADDRAPTPSASALGEALRAGDSGLARRLALTWGR
jgi:DNA-binding FadR family transcriptional regulator